MSEMKYRPYNPYLSWGTASGFGGRSKSVSLTLVVESKLFLLISPMISVKSNCIHYKIVQGIVDRKAGV